MYVVTALYYSCGLMYGTKGKRYVYYLAVKLICDQDPAFMSHLTQTMLQSYGT